MTRQRCVILIDGSNFFFKLKSLKLLKLIEFDFRAFSKHLAIDDPVVQSTYYVGAIRTDGSTKSAKMFNNQRRLLSHLKFCGFTYYLGYLLKSDGVFKEKGVDVKLATDLLF